MANGNGDKTKRRLVKELDELPLPATGLESLETERRRVEEVLMGAEQQKSTFLNNLSELIVFQDLEHRVIWANKVAGESVGISPEELVGRYCYDVWGKGGGPCPGCPVAKARETEQLQSGEMISPDGKVWLVKGYPIRDANGDITGQVEMTREITERKQAEEALQAEKNKLQSVMDSVEDGLTMQDKDYNILYQNGPLRKNYGDCVGEKCYRVYENRDAVCDGCQVKKAFNDGKSHTAERKVVLPSGEEAFGEVTASPIRDAKGKMVSCLEIIRNITEHKQAEEALQAEKNKLQSVIGAMEDDLSIQDKDYNIIYQNEPSRISSGGDRTGEKCYRAYEGRDEVCEGCPVEKAYKDGKSHSSERKWVMPSGEVIFWEAMANPIRDAGGKIVSCLEIARNITERKQADEKRQTVLKTALDGFWLANLEGKFIEVNDSYCEMVGYTREQLLEMSISDIEAIEAPEETIRHINKVMEQGYDRFESQHKRKDGKIIDVEVSVNYLEGEEGQLFVFVRDITERKQVEETLQAEKNKLQSVISSMEDGLTIQDKDFNILYQNEQLKKNYGDHLGEKCYRVYEGRDEVCDGCPVAKALKDGKSHTAQRKVVLPSGEMAFGENTASPIKDAQGKIISCLEINRDVTERKQAEEALQAEKNKLQSVIGAMEDGLTIQDRDYNIVYQNEPAKIIFGDRLGEKCYRAYEGREKLCDGCPVAKALKDGKSHTAERKAVMPSGEVAYWETAANPIRDAEGKIVSCLEIGRDITERKQAEDALRESEGRYRAVVEGTHDMVQSVGLDGNIIFVNKAWLDTLGYTEAELSSLNLFDIIHPDSQAHCQKMFAKVASGKSLHGIEAVFLTKDGRKILVEGNEAPRYIGDKLVATQGVFRDVTERKQAEEALKESEEKFKGLAERSPNMIFINKRGAIVYANEKCEEVMGYKREEFYAPDFNFLNLIAPEYVELIKTNFSKHMQGEDLAPYEYTLIAKDGNRIETIITTALVKYEGERAILGTMTDITERKQAEEALADEATRRRILIDESSDGIVILDEKGKVYEANRRFAEMLGYSPKEVRNLNVWDWEAEFPREQVADMIASIGPEGDHFETQHRRKDGTIFDVEISTNGAVVAGQKLIFCVCRDITERKQAEKTLLEAEEKYKNLAEAASDLIWEVDTQGRYTFVSPNIKDLLGYEVEEVVGKKRTLDFTPRKEVRKWLKRFKEVNAKREGFSGFELLHLHKNGTPVIFEISGIPFFDSAGDFKGYVGINKDVTERKQMTDALRESQEFSTGLLENSPNPIFVLNPDTSVKYVNPAFEKLTGFKLAEIAGRKAPYPWWLKEESKAMALSLKKAMVSGGKKSEKVFHKKNGEPFWVMLNSAPVVYRKKLIYFLISWLDITDRKHAEEEKTELEHKAHLASRLASVGEMASGIAHEINNPLTAVIGFAQLLMDNDLPEEIKEDLVIIHKEAQRAAGVARNLLTFARKHSPSKQPTNVNSIIEGVLTLRAYEQNVSNIKINTKLASDLPEVMADYSQLQQVFINLILNAEAAMLEASNGGTLKITTQKFNHSVRASFADDGPGIDKENLNRIFDPFFTTKEVGKGTGLGLSVCHGIIAEHGGKISARSKPGSGATFIVELPLNSHEQSEKPNEPA